MFKIRREKSTFHKKKSQNNKRREELAIKIKIIRGKIIYVMSINFIILIIIVIVIIVIIILIVDGGRRAM